MPQESDELGEFVARYEIHNNGGRPFVVEIYENNIILLWKNSDPLELLDRFNCEQIFVGKHSDNEPEHDGNTILVNLYGFHYVFIGSTAGVFVFTTQSPIVSFHSPIGNSDVPYPYAIDETGRHYLLIENVSFIPNDVNDINDVYDEYYHNIYICSTQPDASRQIFDNIKEMRIGDNQYTLYYRLSDHSSEYDRLCKHAEDDTIKLEMTFVLHSGDTVIVSREMFIDVMTRFGQLNGFEQLQDVVELYDEDGQSPNIN
jgi:hypothetical protein